MSVSIDQEFVSYQGKSVLVPGEPESERGQCVQWADYVLKDVYGLPYHYGNAIDWWLSPGELLNSFDKITDGSVKKGDFVVFNQTVGSVYGHIDAAMNDGTINGFQGADSNWGGNLTVHLVQHNNASQVLGSLRLKGGDVSAATITDVNRLLLGFMTPEQVAAQGGDSYAQGFVGTELSALIEAFADSPQFLEKRQEYEQAEGGATQLKPGIYKV